MPNAARTVPSFAKLAAVALPLSALVAGADPPGPVEGLPARVSGQVRVSPGSPPPPAPQSAYARRRAVPQQDPGVPGGAEDAFVYLERLDGEPPRSGAAPARILQRDRTVLPHVTAVQVGQVVEFPNEDDVYHNLFSLSPGNRFSLGRYAPGVTERNTFETPGVVRLFCDIHAEMAGVILVVSTPWVSRVNADGTYRLDDVPAGSYRAIAWHPTAGADTVMLDVREPGVAQDFALVAGR